jgi:predicted amidohydrolase
MTIMAAIQMHSNHILQDNLRLANNLLLEASLEGAKLAVLPEAFSYYGFDSADKLKTAEIHGKGLVQDFLSDTAQRLNMWLIGGSIFIKNPDDTINISSLVYDNSGREVARYDKIHLFKANLSASEQYSEANLASHGKAVKVLDTPWGRLGLSICFDLRFPRLYEQFKSLDTDFIVAPSAFLYQTGQFHWDLLVRSRALDCFNFIIAAALVGEHTNGNQTYGHSMIVDPSGQTMAQMTQAQSGVVLADLDFSMVKAMKNKIIREERL